MKEIGRRFYTMGESNAFILKNGEEELVMKSVDLIKPEGRGRIRLENIFGEQKLLTGKLRRMNLVDHKILFEQA
jgi:predicted RNA-binding protein